MFTFNELRCLLAAGELVAAMAILIASRTVVTILDGASVYVVIEGREYVLSQTSDGLSVYLIVTENTDGTFAVDEDIYGWEEAEVVAVVDENTGKNGAPQEEQWQPMFVSLAERICQILQRDGVRIVERDINSWTPDAHCRIVTPEGTISFEYAEERSAVEIVEEAYEQWEQEAKFEEAMQEYDEQFLEEDYKEDNRFDWDRDGIYTVPNMRREETPTQGDTEDTYSPDDQDIPF